MLEELHRSNGDLFHKSSSERNATSHDVTKRPKPFVFVLFE